MTDPNTDFTAFLNMLFDEPTLSRSELAQHLVRPYQQQMIEQLTDPQARRHMIIFDESWPEDEIIWTGRSLTTELTRGRPEPPTGKERERQHWTNLNGGQQPWKAKRKGKRK